MLAAAMLTAALCLLGPTAAAAQASPTLSSALSAAPAFTVTDDSFSDDKATVRLKVLRNTATGEFVSVNTNWGGGVEELTLRSERHAGKLRSVLWTHARNATSVMLNADWRGRMLIPYGNRIGGAKYTWNGSEWRLPINDVAGLNNSLHGLLWDKPLTVLRQSVSATSASVTLRYDFNGEGSKPDPVLARGYPWRLRTELTYTLHGGGGGFEVEAAFTNLDSDEHGAGWPLPVYNGWHPYILAHTAQSTVTLDPCARWLHVDTGVGPQYPPPRYSDMVPTGHTTPWLQSGTPIGGNASAPTMHDDELKAVPLPSGSRGGSSCAAPWLTARPAMFHTTLHDPVDDQTTVLSHESRFLQLWTGAMATFGVDAVVLEPLSAMSDAYNNHDGLHVLSAGERTTNTFGLRIE